MVGKGLECLYPPLCYELDLKNQQAPCLESACNLHAPLFIYLFQDPLSGVLKTEFETPTLPKYQVGGNPSEDIQVKTT